MIECPGPMFLCQDLRGWRLCFRAVNWFLLRQSGIGINLIFYFRLLKHFFLFQEHRRKNRSVNPCSIGYWSGTQFTQEQNSRDTGNLWVPIQSLEKHNLDSRVQKTTQSLQKALTFERTSDKSDTMYVPNINFVHGTHLQCSLLNLVPDKTPHMNISNLNTVSTTLFY